jgi:NAD-dependent dihydropyrimidine dehydrogenase PreA subunit
MAHVINSRCIDVKDQSCVEVCPVDCIHPAQSLDGDSVFAQFPQLYIDPEVCIDCGACVPECPVNAIYYIEDLPEEDAPFIEINANYYLKG